MLSPVFAEIQPYHVLITAGVVLVNCPAFFPAIVKSYFPNTALGKWVENTPLAIQLLIYWVVGGILLYAGFDERARYLREHPPFVPGYR
jgi:hypothetical protein